MATFGEDTFVEGAPPVTLTSHVPTGVTPGTGWVQRGGTVLLKVNPSGWLSTNDSSSSRQVCQFNRSTAWPNDYTVRFSLKYLAQGSNGTNRMGVYGRMQGTGTFLPGGIYFEVWRNFSGDLLTFTLFKVNNDYTTSTLSTVGPVATPAIGTVDNYEVTFVGLTVTATRNGNDIFGGIVAIDLASGPPGVEYQTGDSSPTTGTLIGPITVADPTVPAAAASLSFSTQPAGFVTNTAPGVVPVVRALTSSGNVATGFTGNVTLTIASGPGVIGGVSTVAAVGGIATFSGVKVIGAGDCTFKASAAGLPDVFSQSFRVMPAPGSGVAGGFTQFALTSLAFLLGPQTDPNSDTETPGIARLSANTGSDPLTRVPINLALGTPNPWAVSAQKAGTVSYSGGSTVTGVGTSFLTDLAGSGFIALEIPSGSDPKGEGYINSLLVLSGPPTSNTSAPVSALYGSYFPASVVGGSVAGVKYRAEVQNIDGAGFAGVIEKLMYYDFGLALYQTAYRHQDQVVGATIGDYADRIAKMWWEHPINATARRAGIVSQGDAGVIWPGSRHSAMITLMVWAIRGCPGASFANTPTTIWAYLKDLATVHWYQWLKGKELADHIPFDTRDGGYALHWLVYLSVVHPDSTVRADFLAKATVAARDYFIRLQYPDGTFRAPDAWRDCSTTLVGYPAMQAFLVALLLESLVDFHRSIRADPTQSTLAATILASIKLGVRGLMLNYGGAPLHPGYTAMTSQGNAAVRAMTYSYGGPNLGWDNNSLPNSGCQPLVPGGSGNRWNDPKLNIENNVAAGSSLAAAVSAQRFLNSTSVHVPFYAALNSPIGSQDRSDFLSFGDDMLDAQWAYTDGDGFKSQWDTPAPKNKDWDEHMRAQMKALAWRRWANAGLVGEPLTAAPVLTPTTLNAVTAPGNAFANSPFTPALQVEILDQFGNRITNSTAVITVALATGTGQLLGTLTRAAVNGLATFSDLNGDTSGPKSLLVTSPNLPALTVSVIVLEPFVFVPTPTQVSKPVLTMVQNDTEPPMRQRLLGADGSSQTLPPGTQVKFSMTNPLGLVVINKKACVIEDNSLGDIRYDWAPGELATIGASRGQIEVTFPAPNTGIESFPTLNGIWIIVEPEIS